MAEATRRQCVPCAARAARLLRPRRVRADGAASLRTPISALCVTVSVHHEIAAARPRAAGLFRGRRVSRAAPAAVTLLWAPRFCESVRPRDGRLYVTFM